MAAGDAKPIPKVNTALRITFEIRNTSGTLISGATGLDSEISKDGGTFTDCTNEATEIATSSGVYYLDLTSTEMNCDTVAIVVKTTSANAVYPVIVLYPAESGGTDLDVNTVSINNSTAAAISLEKSANLMTRCTVDGTGTNTTTQVETTTISEATADHFKGRVIFGYGATALNGQAAKITAYALVSGRGRFTVEQMTDAFAGGDTFLIV